MTEMSFRRVGAPSNLPELLFLKLGVGAQEIIDGDPVESRELPELEDVNPAVGCFAVRNHGLSVAQSFSNVSLREARFFPSRTKAPTQDSKAGKVPSAHTIPWGPRPRICPCLDRIMRSVRPKGVEGSGPLWCAHRRVTLRSGGTNHLRSRRRTDGAAIW